MSTSSPAAARQAPARHHGRPRQPAYVWCFTGSLVLSIFSGHTSDLGLPIGPDRVLFAGGALLLLLDPTAWHEHGRLRWRPVHLLMVVLVVLAAASAFIHGTLLNSYGFFALLDRLIVPLLLFCLAPVVYASRSSRDLLLKVLVVLGLYLGLTAVFQQLGPHSLVWPRYVLDPNVGIQSERARGPFAASEPMGMVLAQCAFAATLAAARFRSWWRAVSLLVLPLAAIGILLTLTRSVWVGAAAGAIVTCLIAPRLRRWLPILVVGAAVAVLGLLAAVPSLSSSVTERAGTVRSVDDRSNTNAAALRIVEQHPLTGVGWVRFVDVAGDYVRQADDYPVTNINIEVHNVVLGRAAELGIPGAALWVGCVLLGPVAAGLRRSPPGDEDSAQWRLVALASCVMWLFPEMLSPNPYPTPNFLTWTLAGIALRWYLLEQRSDPATKNTPA